MALNTRSTPSLHQIAVGRAPEGGSSNTNLAHHFRQNGALGEVLIEIQNLSNTQTLTLAVATSADNSSFSTKQVRLNGTLSNSVTVQPKATVTVAIDGPLPSLPATAYWRFVVSNQQVAFGTVSISHDLGELILDKRVFS